MNLYGLRKDVDKLKQGVASRRPRYEMLIQKGAEMLVSFARDHHIEVDRERAEKLLGLIATARTNDAFDPCQMLIEGGATPEQAAARVKEAERLWAAKP
jgi:hypothetical protein